MVDLLCLSIPTALLCGVWSYFADSVGLLGWAGFAGCTAFFAAGGMKGRGVRSAAAASLSGVFWGICILMASAWFPHGSSMVIATVIATFFMCIQSKISCFKFIPGTFIGCFAVFAAGGDYIKLAISIILGILLGALCDLSSIVLSKLVQKQILSNHRT